MKSHKKRPIEPSPPLSLMRYIVTCEINSGSDLGVSVIALAFLTYFKVQHSPDFVINSKHKMRSSARYIFAENMLLLEFA
jgi:hypothetical protein